MEVLVPLAPDSESLNSDFLVLKTTVVAKSIFYRISLVLLKTSLTTMYYVAVFLLLTTNSLFAQGRELTPDRVNQRVQLAAVEVLVNG